MYVLRMHKKEPQKPQEHTSDYVKSQTFLDTHTHTHTPPNPLGGPDHVHDTGARAGCSWV